MADEIGLKEIVARLDHYADKQNLWSVSPLLRELAERGEKLSGLRARA
jgi:3-hydroxyacyl-CoA dehydrogenase